MLYRRNRYFDPNSGQFTQADPIGIAGGMNAFGFAGGIPSAIPILLGNGETYDFEYTPTAPGEVLLEVTAANGRVLVVQQMNVR